MRQQRTANNRGQIMPASRRYVSDMGWRIDEVTGAVVRLQLYGITGSVFIAGIPTITTDNGEEATGAVFIAPDQVDVTLDAVPPLNFVLIVPPLDPGVRSSSGAFLANAEQQWRNPSGEPPATAQIGNSGTAAANKVSVFSDLVGGVTLGTGVRGNWAIIVVTGLSTAPITVSGASAPASIDPGDSGTWLHDGSSWNV